MEPIFYVMAIMGCGDGSQQCTQARVEPAHYTTMAQCQAQMPAALARNTDVDFPEIAAACQASGTRMVKVRLPENPRG